MLTFNRHRPAAPDALVLHSTATSCAAIRAKSWVPFAFRLVRALSVILDHTQLASDTKFANRMLEHAAEHSRTACLPWLNVTAHPAPCHSVIQAIASASPTASGGRPVKLVCSCCCYASEYALVCAFFLEQGPNPYFIDVVTGCASACMPSSQSLLAGNNVIACAYAGEFVAATDSMSLFMYRFGVCFGNMHHSGPLHFRAVTFVSAAAATATWSCTSRFSMRPVSQP